jgi:hypothetical protein
LSSTPFGEALRVWLVGALEGEDGRERHHDPVIAGSGVSRGTFYKILAGKGDLVGQAKIAALALWLGADVPLVDRVLRLPGDPLYRSPVTQSPAGRGDAEDVKGARRTMATTKSRAPNPRTRPA